jgi:hypothetical protein
LLCSPTLPVLQEPRTEEEREEEKALIDAVLNRREKSMTSKRFSLMGTAGVQSRTSLMGEFVVRVFYKVGVSHRRV